MIDFTEAGITGLLFSRMKDGEADFISETITDLGEAEHTDVLKKMLLKPFSSGITTLEFGHSVAVEHNVLFNLSREIYQGGTFEEEAKKILTHLSSVSKHPNIKDGDVFIVKFDDLRFGDTHHQALGIYKIENKETYVEALTGGAEKGELKFRKGIGDKNIDKGCLIIFTEEPYTIMLVDRISASTDYWMNEFVNATFKNDNAGNTFEHLQIAKEFIMKKIPADFEVSKPDQIDLLNRSISYFKNNEVFDQEEFQKEVFHHPQMVSSFKDYSSDYVREHELELMDNFSISPAVVKRQARVFKSVLKLDRNFHIYIHGDKELIEKGFDDQKGMSYYKVYFREES